MTNHIRIPDVSPVTQVVADGAKAVFSFPFPIFQAADLEVRANSTLLTSGYTVLGEGSTTGGAVIFADAPASGVRITLRRRQTYARTDDFLDERAPTPHELNDAVDENVAAIQELAEQVSRAVTRPLSADLSQAIDLSLPNPEAGKVIGWNGQGTGLANLDTQADIPVGKVQVDVSDTPDYLESKLDAGANIAVTKNAHSMTIAVTGLAAVATSGAYDDLAGKPSLGSAAYHADTDFASAAQGTKADTALQPAMIDTSATLAANSDSLIASQKAVKTYVDNTVAAGDADALLKSQNLADLSNVATARSNLGLGSAALKDIGTSGANVPLLNAANTYGAPQTPAAQTLTDAATVNIAVGNQVWKLTTTAARSIGAPTGGTANTFYFLEIVTNGFTPAWDSAFDFGTAGAPTALTGTCGFDVFYDGSKYRISTRFTGGA